jgi:hypothetical protein
MSIDTFADPQVQSLIDHFGKSRKMAVFIGAGSSIEAGLPTWEELVERLLDRAASEKGLFASNEHRREWVDSMLRVESLMGAASVVEGLLGDRLSDIAAEELFRGRNDVETDPPTTSADYTPGPIALQLASLREVFDGKRADLKIYTTNYDSLLEVALRTKPELQHYTVYPYIEPGNEPDHPLKVRHLHGYLGGEIPNTPITLTERSYFGRQDEDAWQWFEVLSLLKETPALFLGTSLTDINIIRYLYQQRHGKTRHAVVFVRQAEIYDVPETVRSVREQVAIERWDSEHVDVVFVDHYADVAQLLTEIARRHSQEDRYVSLPQRAKRYFSPLRESVLKAETEEPEQFLRHQTLLNKSLLEILDEVCAGLAKEDVDLSTEVGLALALWLVDPSGRYLTSWATTDRLHCRLSGLQTVELDPQHRFVASTAFCTGTYAEDERNFRNSRWSYIVGIPLWTHNSDDLGRMPVGTMTMTTQTACNETKLALLSPPQRATLARILAMAALARLDDFREAAQA